MIWQFDILLLTLVLVCAVLALSVTDLMGAAIIFGAYSFLMCLIWAGMGAIDVAFTEAAVGAGVSTVFFIATIYNTSRTGFFKKKGRLIKYLSAIVVLVLGSLLLSTISDFPVWGDPHSPVNSHVSSYYLEHSMEHSKVPNVVTSVLADYRGFDTMFETCVVFVACIGIYAILRRRKTKEESSPAVVVEPAPYNPSDSVIIRTASQIMVPFMQLFALYVVAHGHHSPGGGFQGGVILGASVILLAMSYDLKKILSVLNEKWMLLLSAIGVLIYAGIGLLCMFLGGNFLDYSVLSKILPGVDSVMARSHAMLGVEVGVALTVMCAMYAIYVCLSSDGRLDKGL